MRLFKTHNQQAERGVALLFSVLMTSALLLVAIGISNVSYKQSLFSAEARDSGRSFFAADTGIECGLFLDKQDLFQGSTFTGVCRNTSFTVNYVGGLTESYQFSLPLGLNCAQVSIKKYETFNTASYTRIESVGYNVPLQTNGTCTPSSGVSARVVNRALGLRYPNPTP